MALGLKQIRDLVAKWKATALKENDAYFDKLREQKIDEYLAENKDLADLIRETQEALEKAKPLPALREKPKVLEDMLAWCDPVGVMA